MEISVECSVATYLLYMLYTSTSSNLCIASLFEYACICYSLSSNSISDEGARAVADGMKYCTSLKSLK